ncbi:MAG: phosphonopyruvate decarboxylase [Eubacterium sp.]|nr:phosphonopyruvate decarboxylase [Eubacterium sp.]
MQVEAFFKTIGAEFYTGVPDSQLKALCDFLMEKYGTDPVHHVIAANEGNATALAAGYHLATGHVPVVYMQNSGEGNVINPLASLLSDDVYGIPCIFVIGWRGEPGVKDEPQHVYQGKVTGKLLEVMDVAYEVLSPETTEEDLRGWMDAFSARLAAGKSVAIVVRKGALTFDGKVSYKNEYKMTREEIIECIVKYSGEDPIVSTTGKASRELFEIRDVHAYDFLTVGSMGHASSIALGIALQKPDRRIWCIDGDGAALMHMGAMAVISDIKPKNMIHVVINNGAHETVGGQPTALKGRNLKQFAEVLGYERCYRAEDMDELEKILTEITSGWHKMLKGPGDDGVQKTDEGRCVTNSDDGPIFLEICAAIGARADLGRPTTSPKENKEAFMGMLAEK